ncbi:MAG TPA: glycosyltransferase family 4 protein [Pirellulales bacterium]|jgi:UDP-glucose:(heptosyl)LPS alpha-1,3-glucosyltransferase|nr:glycosyltransferase family 4 protein [Pirellulales bacterium]
MNIGIVIESLDPRRGGVEQWTWQFTNRLAAWGHTVHVLAQSFGPQKLGRGIVAHHVESGRSRLEFAAAAEARARALPLDVVHDTGCGWYADVFQPHGGSRTASAEQNLLLAPRWLRPLKRRAARWLPRYREFRRLVDRQYAQPRCAYLAISQMVASDMRRYHSIDDRQIRLVYNGVDLERFSPRHRAVHRVAVRRRFGIADHELLLLIVAHNFRLKGVPTLLRTVTELARKDEPVRLAIAGGKRLAPWQRILRRLGVADRVTLLGSIDDPVPLYAAADVYVQPTFYDPCSLVVLEALASGLPVITSRFNGAGELITPGQEGFILDDPADHAELTNMLRRLVDPLRRQAIGVAARRLAEEHSLDRNCREILAVYEEIVARRQQRAA